MKKLLLLLLIGNTGIGFGQTTLIPDANFELALINNGYDNVIDGSVLTANIDAITFLSVQLYNISDLTGIEDFTALTVLYCDYNQLTSLDVSENTALTSLDCKNNQLTSLDVSENTALTGLDCRENQLTSLDVSQNTALTILYCYGNQLTCLNVANGNNTNFVLFAAFGNSSLFCIEVDNAAWSTANLFNIDPQTSFSENCNYPANCFSTPALIQEYSNQPKTLIKIVDFMGRETEFKPNTPLIFIYSDGTRERVMEIGQ